MARNIRTLIVVPENNTTMEPEISALCPALAPLSVADCTILGVVISTKPSASKAAR